jgi:CDP-diacylglycerol--serine O-phosphatidyltransferase
MNVGAQVRVRGRRGIRRGVYILPSLFTMANMFCGYCCIVFTMRDQFETAAPFIGLAVVLDMLDGRIARLTGTTSEFGIQFDSLADVISFGVAPALLAFKWGLVPFDKLGWATGFIFVSAAAIRLARFNIQTAIPGDRRYFVGMPSPAAAAVLASTVFAYPYGLRDWLAALALPMVIIPALLMVSTIRYRSFKTLDLKSRRSYRKLILVALVIAAIATHPQAALATLAYTYLLSAFVGLAWTKLRRRDPAAAEARDTDAPATGRDQG